MSGITDLKFYNVKAIETDPQILYTGSALWLNGAVQGNFKVKRNGQGITLNLNGSWELGRNNDGTLQYDNDGNQKFYQRIMWGHGINLPEKREDMAIRRAFAGILLFKWQKQEILSDPTAPIILGSDGTLIQNPEYVEVIDENAYKAIFRFWTNDKNKIIAQASKGNSMVAMGWTGILEVASGITLWMFTKIRRSRRGLIYAAWPSYNSNSVALMRLVEQSPELEMFIAHDDSNRMLDRLADGVLYADIPDELKKLFKEHGKLAYRSRENITVYSNNTVGFEEECLPRPTGEGVYGRVIPCNGQLKSKMLNEQVLPYLESLGVKGLTTEEKEEEAMADLEALILGDRVIEQEA